MLGRESGYRYSVDKTSVTLSQWGQLSVGATIANRGSAPSYEPWKVQVELVNSAGALSWSGTLPAKLEALHGGGVSQAVQASWWLPGLPAGAYTVRLIARDARAPVSAEGGTRAPLKWTISERGADGGVTLRTVLRR